MTTAVVYFFLFSVQKMRQLKGEKRNNDDKKGDIHCFNKDKTVEWPKVRTIFGGEVP